MQLSSATLARRAASVAGPRYDRAAAAIGVIHLGIGAFHRAHQAPVFDDALASGDLRWGILGASLRRPDTRDALMPQDGLYTLAVRSKAPPVYRVIGAVKALETSRDDPTRLIAAMARPSVAIVSLTVTEKGYCHRPADGMLDESHPDILHDLAHPETPRTTIGILAAALRARRAAGVKPFTLLSCDNLPSNGRTLKQVLVRYATLIDQDFGAYVAGEVACPSTMVDRIVPATTESDRADVEAAMGLRDAWPVVTEPFWQWVIEDDFPAGRPDFAAFGVELVADVAPYETMKLRLLNGAHSALAYLGQIAGYETVADAIAVPAVRSFVTALQDEATATLPALPGFDTAAYRARLLERFANPALRHRTAQIAMDGSQKIPQRWLATLRDRRAMSVRSPAFAFALALWIRALGGVDDAGRAIPISDPRADLLTGAVRSAGPTAEARVTAVLRRRDVFGDDMADDPWLGPAVARALEQLDRHGALAALPFP